MPDDFYKNWQNSLTARVRIDKLRNVTATSKTETHAAEQPPSQPASEPDLVKSLMSGSRSVVAKLVADGKITATKKI